MNVPSLPLCAFRPICVEDYEPLIGGETVERILKKAANLRDLHIVNVNSTYVFTVTRGAMCDLRRRRH